MRLGLKTKAKCIYIPLFSYLLFHVLIVTMGSFVTVSVFFFARDTYAPVALQHKVNRLGHDKVAED